MDRSRENACPHKPRQFFQIGSIIYVEGHFGSGEYPLDRERVAEMARQTSYRVHGGGPLPLYAIHILDLLRYCLGDAEVVLGNVEREYREFTFETRASCFIKFKNGVYAYMDTGEGAKRGPSLEFSGTKGKILVSGFNFLRIKTRENPRWIDPRQKGRSGFLGEHLEIWGHLKAQLMDLIDSVENDREPNCSGKEGRAAHELMMAIYESERTGLPVVLPLQIKESPLKLMLDEQTLEKKDYLNIFTSFYGFDWKEEFLWPHRVLPRRDIQWDEAR